MSFKVGDYVIIIRDSLVNSCSGTIGMVREISRDPPTYEKRYHINVIVWGDGHTVSNLNSYYFIERDEVKKLRKDEIMAYAL